MREIKFRAKVYFDGNTENYNKFIFGFPVKISNTWYIITPKGERYKIILETLGQYIGIKDKNGIEIYEGDIVKIWDGRPMAINDYGSFIYYEIDRALNEEDLEVIGNVYDNPELLKQNDV